jgi:hypothetical protein
MSKTTVWEVGMSKRAAKGRDNLSADILDLFWALFQGLILAGPVQQKWPHYGKLGGQKKETHHCHLNKSKPIYVVVWKILNKKEKLMEISYVGTHENTPY